MMMMMMMMTMMMNCFCSMFDRRKAFSFISSRDHWQRYSPSRISEMLRAGFKPAQNLSSGSVEWSCAVAITNTPRRHDVYLQCYYKMIAIDLTLFMVGFFGAVHIWGGPPSLKSVAHILQSWNLAQLYLP